ncbi:hypothetical protein Bca101_020154 [Brassica carinata]
MGDYSEEERSYDPSQDSYFDETDQAWSSKEDGCERSWSTDEYSSSEYGDNPGEESPEPEPPDHSQSHTRLYKKGVGLENKSWSNDTHSDSEISMGEEDERDTYPKQDSSPQNKVWESASYGITSYKALVQPTSTSTRKTQSTSAATKKQSRTGCGNTSDYPVFSGSSKDPEQEDAQTYYSNPVLNWGDLKARMYKEFVRKLRTSNNILTRSMYQETQWSSMSTPKPRPAAEKRHAYCPNRRKPLSTSRKPEEVEKISPAKKYQGWTSTTSKHHYKATSRKEVSSLKPENASMPMRTHDLKPKKLTSSVLTPHKRAMRRNSCDGPE